MARSPYALHVSIVANYIVLDVRNPDTYKPIAAHYLSLTPSAGSSATISASAKLLRRHQDRFDLQIETVDMARRGLHNDAPNC